MHGYRTQSASLPSLSRLVLTSFSDWRGWFYGVRLIPGCPTGGRWFCGVRLPDSPAGGAGSVGYGYQAVRLAASGYVGYGYQVVRLAAAGSVGYGYQAVRLTGLVLWGTVNTRLSD